ncbi:GILT-like protein 1 [Penaeus japonicus]|uniref:GILT-like protein 1 n=1 Tax=Penaeus japonicus TaxID=27405 RepID=UPI001C714648|nr:GILT-like protein 1 [Penaeus japonicus]
MEQVERRLLIYTKVEYDIQCGPCKLELKHESLVIFHLCVIAYVKAGIPGRQCIATATTTEKVKVTVFFEALCPDSIKFITTQLYPVWSELRDILELDINAYGKTKETSEGDEYAFRCQHGPRECAANAMLTCAKKYIAEEQQFMNFTKCLMEKKRGILSGQEPGLISTLCNSLAGCKLQCSNETFLPMGNIVDDLAVRM